ncbi:MAG: bifunctional DNA-formamidopyrimidine glycosylase/DNA-(apurinic or apyrimidinic site) lyase [Acidobacteria bacterium]|nr:bifunctional DNA-formamidopyrimidine glycosylase/DNA-(apurinic or apyrimidinic site) lyase [Acidobacteriota bacterium]MCI0622449.1 bifunctional DNA-formamidopyrimidine glycosylase/DNA-(apurinic or apyrimidinic site) lyase [Acidobacteriota bacterium]MCI0722367.1 bifunctional DNA-formamidopyrimidine glycosylase/DNA-(apurinic or apyrimidinic site) lyase [Acidobacteriota bacterium]
MPELPEVETIRLGLLGRVCNKRIERVEIRCHRIILRPQPREMAAALGGQMIRDIQRRGKFLLFQLDDYRLLVHLGMSGQLTYWDQTQRDDQRFFTTVTGLQQARQHAVDKHTHVSLYFDDGNAMHYRDIRQFGKWRLYRTEAFDEAREFLQLGLEPLDKGYTLSRFMESFRGRKLRIKSLLLNQNFVAGVGNIYADEALFEAGIHPERFVHSLSIEEKQRLFRAIPKVLRRGLKHGGTSFQNYFNADGEAGTNQETLRVYGREGGKCHRCRTPIVRIVVSQRGTHFCQRCQPAKRK